MSNIIPMNYDDRSFPFASDCWFNATVAAKHHGRKVTEWLRLPSTKEYMAELCQELGIEGLNYKGGKIPPLVRIEKGRYGGTWLHPELAVEFARWLSVKFARACVPDSLHYRLARRSVFNGKSWYLHVINDDSLSWERPRSLSSGCLYRVAQR